MNTILNVQLVSALTSFLALVTAAAAQPDSRYQCYSDWAAAANTVIDENLVTVEQLSRQFRRQKLGVIVKTELCREPRGYVYRLVVRSPSGRFKATIYDAHRGIEIGVAETGH